MPEENKKLIVYIDDNTELRILVADLLDSKGFDVKTFDTFISAKEFLEHNKPELIISDLVSHDEMNGIEFYIRHIMEKKIEFAIWTGSLDLYDEDSVRKFSLFLEGMPKDYRITYDPKKALKQGEVDLIIEDFKRNKKATFPCFPKPGNIEDILKYFNLSQFVILYLGTVAAEFLKK